MTTSYAVPEAELRAPIRAGRAPADGEALVPIRGGLLASAVLVAVAAIALAVIGFTGSYRSVRELALGWGWGWFSYVFPVGIDVGIIGLIAADLFLCAIRTPAPILRWFAWTLTVATVTFNAASGWPADGNAGWDDLIEAAAHATMPGLVVVITEALRRAIARRARIADGREFEPLGLARWILAPYPTFAMWRRMHLWDVYTRAEALALERDRLTLRDELRDQYGRKWKKEASTAELRAMRDANRCLPIPAHLIANAVEPTANAAAAVTANGASADREHPAAVNVSANDANVTANGANGAVRTPAQVPANDMSTGQPAANGGFVDMQTVRTVGSQEREHPPYAEAVTSAQYGVDLGNSHRERSTVSAAAGSRTVVRSTVPAPYSPTGYEAGADRELVTANGAGLTAYGTANTVVHGARGGVNGVNGHHEHGVHGGPGEDRERSGGRYTEDRAGRRRLALDFLRAREAEQPPPSQAKFAEWVGVAPATVSKAMKEWREDSG
ncbi:DUF2637 domain-containing protein [Streptomyces sp. RLB3-6]|uniref:DUF2637 domain-containing protein n=1 Tax=Streptomyces sp. RLB3-6 TaxID=2594457 RepID=UPI00116387A1|nr:DUF2637 domain-containing protein [Streptomyces sp. RLB3-6]QDN84373.1 DUF2637 domain-containing protein [Streptomyces sp. RLB3-6]